MTRNQILLIVAALVVLALVLLIGSAVYIVDETQQVIITQFGEPVGQPVTTPGLKFKLPFVLAFHGIG